MTQPETVRQATWPALPVLQSKTVRSPFQEISFLELKKTILVINRATGAWAMAPLSQRALVLLLAADPASLPPDIRERVGALAAQLWKHGLTDAAQPQPDDLTTIILKLTNACNYACTYCYDYEPTERATRLDARVAIGAVEQGLRLAPNGLNVIFHGGEPTLVFPLLREIVVAGRAFAREIGKEVRFSGQTNGSRINREMVEFSEEHAINWGISLDGPSALNDHFRVLHNGQGTYGDFERAYREFPSFVRRCGVMTTVTAVNCGGLAAIARHFRNLGFAAWDWSLFQEIGRGRECGDNLEFDTERLIASWNDLFAAVLSGEFDGFPVRPVLSYLRSFLHGARNTNNMCMRRDCGAARDLLSISSDGTIEACDCIDPLGPLAGLGHMGAAAGGELAAARASDRARDLRSRNVETLRCGDCLWLAACGGTCMAHAGAVDAVWDPQCALALNAFDAIVHSIEDSDRLKEYELSCRR